MHAGLCFPAKIRYHCRLQADLAGRDFAAERDPAVVVSTGAAVSDLDRERSAEARAVAEVRLPLVMDLMKPLTSGTADAQLMAGGSRRSPSNPRLQITGPQSQAPCCSARCGACSCRTPTGTGCASPGAHPGAAT